jgi:predicted patatin/cPLA2 family phospholipase
MDFAKDSGIDCSKAPPLKDLRYYAVWLQNKRDPRVFRGFPLLPQELKEYEYLKEKLKKAKESYDKVWSYIKQPINILITARITGDFVPEEDLREKFRLKR